jgi:hypothetical protein
LLRGFESWGLLLLCEVFDVGSGGKGFFLDVANVGGNLFGCCGERGRATDFRRTPSQKTHGQSRSSSERKRIQILGLLERKRQ